MWKESMGGQEKRGREGLGGDWRAIHGPQSYVRLSKREWGLTL